MSTQPVWQQVSIYLKALPQRLTITGHTMHLAMISLSIARIEAGRELFLFLLIIRGKEEIESFDERAWLRRIDWYL